MDIKVNYHSSIIINSEIYIDPLNIKEKGKAKYIFLTHSHFDHFSPDDIKKIINKETIIVCPKSMKEEVVKEFNNELFLVEQSGLYNVSGLKFETFPSYNINKNFHPKENGWCGYVLDIEGEKVAVVGDSDNTLELQTIKTDILLIPIGGTYTMTVDEAARATKTIMPKAVIPTHYGEIVGNKELGKMFVEKLKDINIKCILLIK